jgi:hypothetical protein
MLRLHSESLGIGVDLATEVGMTTESRQHLAFGTIPNEAGQRLAVLVAEPEDATLRHGVVVIAPGYERRMHHYAVFSEVLVSRGISTVRFDLSDHIGASDGEIADLTMTSIAEDVRGALDFAVARFAGAPVVVLAPSLTARAALRVLHGPGESVAGAVLLLPVVDVEATIAQAAKSDLIAEYRREELDPQALYRVVDHDISCAFPRDVLQAGWPGLEATSAEVSRATVPLRSIVAERDDWVKSADAVAVLARPDSHLTVLEATSHDLAHNFPVMRQVLSVATGYIEELLGLAPTDLELPVFDEILATLRAERNWARRGYGNVQELAKI